MPEQQSTVIDDVIHVPVATLTVTHVASTVM